MQIFEDLRVTANKYFGSSQPRLQIHKDQAFEGSSIERECLEVYRPFLKLLTNKETLKPILEGKPFVLNEQEITLDPIYNKDYFQKYPL